MYIKPAVHLLDYLNKVFVIQHLLLCHINCSNLKILRPVAAIYFNIFLLKKNMDV